MNRSGLREKFSSVNLRSLRVILTVPFAIQTLIIVGVVAYLSHQSSSENTEKLVSKLTTEISHHVIEYLQTELESIEKINQINHSIVINDNLANNLNFELLKKTFLAELDNFANIQAIGVVNPPDAVLRITRRTTNPQQFEVQRIDPNQANVLQRFQIDQQGEEVANP